MLTLPNVVTTDQEADCWLTDDDTFVCRSLCRMLAAGGLSIPGRKVKVSRAQYTHKCPVTKNIIVSYSLELCFSIEKSSLELLKSA